MRVLILSVLFAVSCSTISDIKGPDGTPHKLVSCGNIENCYKDATEACGTYKIVNSTSESDMDKESKEIDNTHNLLIKCTADSK